MLHLWRMTKTYTERASRLDLLLLAVCSVALGVLMGLVTSHKKKVQTGLVAGGVFAATCVPILNKWLDIVEEVTENE